MTITCSHARTLSFERQECQSDAGFGLPFVPNVVVFSTGGYGNVPVSRCNVGLDLPFVSNVVPLSAGGYDDVPAPLLVTLESVENTVLTDQLGSLVNCASSLFPAPHDMRMRLAESMLVGRSASCGHIVADSCVSFVLRGVRRSAFHLAETEYVEKN